MDTAKEDLAQTFHAMETNLEDKVRGVREDSTRALEAAGQHHTGEMDAIRHNFSRDVLTTRHMLGNDMARQKWALENNSILNGAEYAQIYIDPMNNANICLLTLKV